MGLSQRRSLHLKLPELPRREKPQLEKLQRDFRLCEIIGRGSSGRVYRAQRRLDGDVVAVKLSGENSRREFEILRSISHPHLVRGLAYFRSANFTATVLSFHEGQTLSLAVKEGGCFKEKTAVSLFLMLMSALAYLHSSDIVHCDVKPENLIVSQSCQNLTLVDFGAAYRRSEVQATTCTLEYSSPEVLDGEIPDERHDVWCAGLCLYFMVQGCLPVRLDLSLSLEVFKSMMVESLGIGSRTDIAPTCRPLLEKCLTVEWALRPDACTIMSFA